MDIIEGTGIFLYPLLACSILALGISLERLFFLRQSKVLPKAFAESFIEGNIPERADDSISGRILDFFYRNDPDSEQLKAYARLQVLSLERGLFLLDVVVAAAPLLGLMGTVWGLIKVFSNIAPDGGMPDQTILSEGIAMALSTTMIGLAIAIPALVAVNFFNRRVDLFAGQISVGVERLIDLHKAKAQQNPPHGKKPPVHSPS